jgi:hypothetical protein
VSAAFGDSRLPERFWAKVSVNAETGCWEWTAGLHTAGYANFSVGGRPAYGHRVAVEAFGAPIPEGLVCDHLCRTRHCVNPLHIEVVPQRTNVVRGDGPRMTRERFATKTHCKQGHALTEDNLTNGARRRCKACCRASTAKHRRLKRGDEVSPNS